MHAALEHLLRVATGVEAHVVGTDRLAHVRGAVTRVLLDRDIPGTGATVIVKRRDPESGVAAFASANLGTEVAALSCLTAADVDVAPRLIAGGVDAGMLVLTDVGSSVESVLFADDYAAARSALIALADATARLHRAPLRPDAFRSLGTWTIATRESGWRNVIDTVERLGLPPVPLAAHHEHDVLLAEVRSPGPATALVHGDLVPSNAMLDSRGHCRLVDFEGSGLQHIGLDAAMLRFPFAWYGRWALVPAEVQGAMEAAYRDGLGWPDATLDAVTALGCMAMTLLRLERLPRIADTTQPVDTAFRRRVQIVSTIDVATEAARRVGRFPHLTTWLDQLRRSMRDRWREARQPAPRYPAFATSPIR